MNDYIKVTIGDNQVEVTNPDELPISISYALESPDNFQEKRSSESLSLVIPATLANDVAANTYRSGDVKDLTATNVYRGYQKAVIEAAGVEILTGKAFLDNGTHNDKPKSYEYNLYGDNADWKIDMEELTLYDLVGHLNFTFDQTNVINSWAYDGTNEALPYVFAPVRYRGSFGSNMKTEYMRPSLSKYWLLYWGFKKLGYRLQSNFGDTSYYRRQVMPWTWGNFLSSDGTKLSVHNFLAKSTGDVYYSATNGRQEFYWDLDVSNDSTSGAFDNNNDYAYLQPAHEMEWTYNTPNFGSLTAAFSMTVFIDAGCNGSTSEVGLSLHYFKNGTKVGEASIVNLSGPLVGGASDVGLKELFFSVDVNPGDKVSAKLYLNIFKAKLGYASISANVQEFKLDYFRIPVGGTIDFTNYTGLKKYKFLDFLRGEIDMYNLSVNTDSKNKVVVLEPTHEYSLSHSLVASHTGYFLNDWVDWNGKEDFSKDWKMQNYSDHAREVTFRFKPDNNDGILKIIQDRNINTLAAGKYVFPTRFKAGKKDYENRFFSATMHYEVDEWKDITGIAPQMVCLVPENISNTSNSESSNTFEPKTCYYKGLVTGVGGWRFDGTEYTSFPFMFAVNYKDGGHNDPILSYSDERIKDGTGSIVGHGLLKRFYWQRLAIMRNGQFYNTWFKLNNKDVASLHREYKAYNGQKWELVEIKDYKPLQRQGTSCFLRKWAPVESIDNDNTFPSANTILNGATPAAASFDIKYEQLKCLTTDIPS